MAKKTKKTSKKKTIRKTPAKKKARPKETSAQKEGAKKTVVKKTRKKKVASQKRRRALTAEEIQHFRELLLEKWREIVGDVSSIENEALKKSRLDASGDISSMPIHMADLGTDNFEQEFALGLMDGERKLLAEIVDALRRIDDGVYGLCRGTGKPIPRARLEANPWARYCVEYAAMVEQGLVSENKEVFEEQEEEYEDENEPEATDELEGAEELEEDETEEADYVDYDEIEEDDEFDEEES